MSIQFIVEDGTGKADATAYISTADLDQFYENNGFDWSVFADDDEKQQYINRCTSYIDNSYSFTGTRNSTTQALSWPRFGGVYEEDKYYTYFIENNIVPKELKKAVALLVYYTKSGKVSLDQYYDGKLVKRQLDRIEGAITSETEYFGSGQNTFSIVEIDRELKRILSKNSNIQGVNSLIRGCE